MLRILLNVVEIFYRYIFRRIAGMKSLSIVAIEMVYKLVSTCLVIWFIHPSNQGAVSQVLSAFNDNIMSKKMFVKQILFAQYLTIN